MSEFAKFIDVVALSRQLCQHPIPGELKYSTSDNLVGRPLAGYEANVVLLTRAAARALCEVQNSLVAQHGVNLVVYEAFRPKRAIADMLAWSKQPVHGAHEQALKQRFLPNIPKDQLFKLGYIAEDSGHCYGNTVDVMLLDAKTGQALDLGAEFDFMDELSHPSIQPPRISEAAYRWRMRLQAAMVAAGFQPYAKEFWHFSHGGRDGREVQAPQDFAITAKLANLNCATPT